MRSNNRPRNTLASFTILWILVLVGRALAEGDSPDLPPGPEDPGCTMMETYAPAILSYWWFISGVVASATGIVLHGVKTRGNAYHWRGDQPTWVQFWILPMIVATIVYAVVCGASLIYVSQACPVVGNYFQSNVGMGHVATVLLGELLAILPAVILAFRGREQTTYATEGM